MPQLPLYRFFQALRKANFALGVSDYGLLLEAMNGGFGLRDEVDLLRLCRTLWFKPGHSWELFQELFHQSLADTQKRSSESPSLQKNSASDDDLSIEQSALDQQNELDEELDDHSELAQENTNAPEEKDLTEVEGEFVHLSIASSAELAGEDLQSEAQLQTQLQSQSYIFQGRYQAISQRQLTQSWRYLPDRSVSQPSDQIDINATVESIAKSARLEHLVYQKQKIGISRLLLLIDYEGSMVAFHELAQQIADSAPKPEGKGPNTLYFHDVPGPQFFRDPDQTQASSIPALLPMFRHRKAAILIVSDAGAARGRYDRQRVIQTQAALKQLQALGQHIVWLNPIPRNRWQGSSAEFIDKLLVPMYELSEMGMQQAVNALRGKINRKK